MSESPSWLNESTTPIAKGAVSSPAVQKAALAAYVPPPLPPATSVRDSESGVVSQVPSDFNIEPETLKKMAQYHLYLRILYCTTAIFLGVAAGLSLVNQDNLGLIFFAFYVLFFSLLICCFELAFSGGAKYIANNFGFLYSTIGRWVFLLFVGFMAFSLGPIGIASMCWLYVVGLFHMYCCVIFPKFDEYIRRKHYYDGSQ